MPLFGSQQRDWPAAQLTILRESGELELMDELAEKLRVRRVEPDAACPNRWHRRKSHDPPTHAARHPFARGIIGALFVLFGLVIGVRRSHAPRRLRSFEAVPGVALIARRDDRALGGRAR